MRHFTTNRGAERRRGEPIAALLLTFALFAVAGCDVLDNLLSVEAPSDVLARNLQSPDNAGLLVEGVIADFDCAFVHYTISGGLVGTELMDSQATAAQWNYDRRAFTAGGGWFASQDCGARLGTYVPLSTARWAADNALTTLDGWSDDEVANRGELIATSAAYAGYSYLLFGEGFCSAAFDTGPELQPGQILELAENRFTRAIAEAQSAGRDDLLNLAYLGRARTRLNLAGRGDASMYGQAAADAAQIPAGFVYHASFSEASNRSANRLFDMTIRDRQASVYERFWDLEFGGVPDPRVALNHTGAIGPNQRTVMVEQTKYTTRGTDMPIARWAEAQLIIAEAELEANNLEAAVDIINVLHAAAGLPDFASSDETEIRNQIIEERQRELFLESHHLGDMLRYGLPFEPASGEEFVMGGFYGNMTCFPLPDVERNNNPNIP